MLLYFIGWLAGLLLGFALANVFILPRTHWGYIAVDQDTQQARVHLYPVEFKNNKVKKVVLQVVYGAKIPKEESREEHGL